MSTEARTRPAAAPGELTGWHVLAALVAFFGVVFAVNGYFLANALRTYTGVVSVEPYVKGLKYNERIEAGERQAALGWHEAVSATVAGTVELTLRHADGRPVERLRLSGVIGRPSTHRLDKPVALSEVEPGLYRASVGALEQGTWLLAIEATGADAATDVVYRLRRRLWLKP